MLVSFDIDGVLADSVWVGEDAWQNGGREHFYTTLVDMKPRFPKLIPYINRLSRHHVVQLNSARRPTSELDSRKWAKRIGISPTITINCLGDAKLDYLIALNPDLHFDDHPGFVIVPGGIRVWHPTWCKAPTEGMVSTAEEIIERIANEKKKRYGPTCGCEAADGDLGRVQA